MTGSFTDPAFGVVTETFTGTATWSDGVITPVIITGNTFSSTRSFPDDDPTGTPSDLFTVGITINDDDGGSGNGSTSLTVNNVAPVVTAISNSSPECGNARDGEPVAVSATFSDVGMLDTHTAVIDWGDGTLTVGSISEANGNGTVSGSHAYATGGYFTIMVTVIDDDGGASMTSSSTVISGVGLFAGQLIVVGTEGNDHIVVHKSGSGSSMQVVVQAKFGGIDRSTSSATLLLTRWVG